MLFSKILGQEQPKQILTALYEKKHFPALLFTGPKGIGKRTTAINFAQIINCATTGDVDINQCARCQQIGNLIYPDIKVLFPIASSGKSDSSNVTDSDDNKFLDEIGKNINSFALGQSRPYLPASNIIPIRIVRWLKQEMSYKPLIGQYKIIIILDADRMNKEAANAFLKTLEEPQPQTIFILTTERISRIIPTIRSRCQTIRFFKLPKDLIIQQLKNNNISDSDAKLAAEVAEGSLRTALDFQYHNIDFLPDTELLSIFDRSKSSALESLNFIINNDPEAKVIEKLIIGLLFIFRKSLQVKLQIPVEYNNEIIKTITSTLTTEQIVQRISILLNVLNDTELHLNKKLSLFTILSNIRF